MDEQQVTPNLTTFEDARHLDEAGREYWTARKLMTLLGYKSWQNFERTAITEAKKVCANEGLDAVAKNFNDTSNVSGSRSPKRTSCGWTVQENLSWRPTLPDCRRS